MLIEVEGFARLADMGMLAFGAKLVPTIDLFWLCESRLPLSCPPKFGALLIPISERPERLGLFS